MVNLEDVKIGDEIFWYDNFEEINSSNKMQEMQDY